MAAAVSVGNYLIAHSLVAHEEMKTDSDLDLARQIAKWLASAGLAEITKRVAYQRFKSSVRRADELDAPLQILIEAGHIRTVAETTGKKPGRPSKRFTVNPAVSEVGF